MREISVSAERFDLARIKKEIKDAQDEINWIERRLNALHNRKVIDQVHLLMSYMSIVEINDTWKGCERILQKVLQDPDVESMPLS